MRSINKIFLLATGLLFILNPYICQAQDIKGSPFQGVVNADNINIRSDSTVTSKTICVVNKGERLDVIKGLYDWYKIRLPKQAPSYINKGLVELIGDNAARVTGENINIRLGPEASSAIVGKIGKNEVVNILGEKGEWYKIEPPNIAFGWVHKKFIDKIGETGKDGVVVRVASIPEEAPISPKLTKDETIAIEGIVNPYGKVFKRIATHKIVTADKRIFLLKGNRDSLNSLNYHKVKVTGKLTHPGKQKYPTIEIERIEAINWTR